MFKISEYQRQVSTTLKDDRNWGNHNDLEKLHGLIIKLKVVFKYKKISLHLTFRNVIYPPIKQVKNVGSPEAKF